MDALNDYVNHKIISLLLFLVYAGARHKSRTNFSLKVETTEDRCPIGEKIGNRNRSEGKIPVFSCEGACIRGEIARVAANLVAKNDPYRRGCHGELLTIPGSAMAEWIKDAEKVVLIDGCFLRCHGRILENLIGKDKLVQFDALSHYKKYTDLFDIESVPENERKQTAQDVANWVISNLEKRALRYMRSESYWKRMRARA